MSEALLCCLPVDHKLAKRRRIDLRQLSDEPFILFPRTVSPHYHDQIIATCVEAGFSPQIRHEARLWQTVVTMVEFQMGVALVPEALARTRSQRAVFIPLERNTFSSQILRLTRAGSQLDLTERFLAALTTDDRSRAR